MDTLSHTLIGIAVAGLSGQPATVNDPVYIATLLGAQAPDFDIIALLRGNLAYLKQHRAFSHSFPGLALWSALITIAIHLFMPQSSLLTVFSWAYIGGISHIGIDYFNTHGAAILWPFRADRKSVQLLNVFDPILLSLMLLLYAGDFTPVGLASATLATIIVYIGLRLYLRQQATKWLTANFAAHTVSRITVMPALKRLFFWDFVLETDVRYFIGQISAFYPLVEIHASLPKATEVSSLTVKAQKTPLGDFFSRFTPFIYYEEQLDVDLLKVNIYDLRYIINQQFLHQATIIFNERNIPAISYMHSHGRKFNVPC
ncbi:MAG: metal-dependent hydrolase [Veillonellales bacterium]